MIPRLLISRIYALPVCVFFLIAGSLASNISSNIWVLDRNFENNPNTSELLWEKDGISLFQCCYLCDWNPSCMSFFYHPSLMKCLASQSYKRGLPASQAMQQGWKYYTKPQCDGDYVYSKTLGLCYKLHTEMMNYSDAMAACETEGAKLLIIRNKAEHQHLGHEGHFGYLTWAGLHAMNANREWKWWNGRPALNIDFFFLPDSSSETGDLLCGAYTPESTWDVYFAKWCSDRMSFVCQKYI